MVLDKAEAIGKVSAFIALCVAISTEGSNNANHYKTDYLKLRSDVLSLGGIIKLPSWFYGATDPLSLISHVKITVEGGHGAWQRRREYFKEQRDLMLKSIESFQDESIISSSNAGIHTETPIAKNVSKAVKGNVSSNFTHSFHSSEEKSMLPQKKNKIFIVHGHDESLKYEVARFVDRAGFESIILHENANSGMTIIDKLEHYISDVAYAIVLYTPCDEGKAKSETHLNSRARQNVVFEHGLLIGKLGRDKVAAIKESSVEIPGDLQGVLYIDKSADWKYQLTVELKNLK